MIEPVKVEAIDLAGGRFRVTNRYDFIPLDHLSASWSIAADGKVISSGTLAVPRVDAGQTQEVTVPYSIPTRDCWLTISFALAADQTWAARGHEVAWTQFKLPVEARAAKKLSAKDLPPLSIDDTVNAIRITGADFELIFDRIHAVISSWTSNGQSLIKSGPKLNFWRATTDNDRAWDNAKSWRDAGLDVLRHRTDGVEVTQPSPGIVRIVAKTRIAPPIRANGFDCEYVYTILGNGEVLIEVHGVPTGTWCRHSAANRPHDVPAG